jgi:phage baseplate assembly protein W
LTRFIQHIVRYGDTMQGIAQQRLGDMSQWVELTQFNDLRYPYIVETLDEKMENPEHLVTIGDIILVKVANDPQADLIQELRRSNDFDQEELYALALGKDLDILPLPVGMTDPGQDSDTLEMKTDNRGRLKTVRGIENLKQSLYIRLITPKGSYVGHPEYGSNIHMYLGMKNTPENASLIDLEIERTFRTDSRVTRVDLLERKIVGNQYIAAFSVSSITLEDAFEFVVSAQQDGPIALLDNFNNGVV